MGIMRNFIGGAALAFMLAALGAPAYAQDAHDAPQKVVELYTSQGCSSCPPADKMLGDLDALPGVLGLSLHVPYWDYLGWPDKYARPEHESRQHGYRRALQMRSVYTPQMIIGGQFSVVGGKRPLVEKALKAYPAPRAQLRISEKPGAAQTLLVRVTPLGGGAALSEPANVLVVGYDPQHSVHIEEGENAGRRLTYYNVVRHMAPIARWDGVSPIRVPCARPATEGVAVLVQQGTNGQILGAARMER